ncbi:MAG: hypothetical protein QOE93_692 [Actinomycetota bacterium]|jgi:beta-lactamase superfamily II metal-dependent hydrolase|nr:hypothetical protein [Actinomycetota bacterium]
MTSRVTVRMYNVGFGDCFLVQLHGAEGERPRAVLIDCGRHSGTLEDAPDFWDVVRQVVIDLPKVKGRPAIDVLVMTHRHRDHVHGFSKGEPWENVQVGEVWMPWTENDADPVAKALRELQHDAATRSYHALLTLRPGLSPAREIALNSITNQSAMTTLRGFKCPVRYLPDPLRPQATVVRGTGRDDLGLPADVIVHVLGPSRDKKTITTLDPPAGAAYLQLVPADPGEPEDATAQDVPAPWGGDWDLDADKFKDKVGPAASLLNRDFLDDVERAAATDAEGLAMSVDKALNGTSLVLLFEIGDQFLLFPGDAQWGTWQAMLADKEWMTNLKKVTFLKVGHHGSHNATPVEFVEKCLTNAKAMISVSPTVYDSKGWKQIPKKELMEAMRLKHRVGLLVRSDDPVPAEGLEIDPGGLWTEVSLDVKATP